jgi:fatty acyl-CoA reductase
MLHIYGTQQVLELCRKISKLDCLIHLSSVSTWFVKDRLEEKIFSSSVDSKQLLHDMLTKSEEEIEDITNDYIGQYPKYANAYFFTKTISEVHIKIYATDLKVAVVRLPFMGGAVSEPTPGWFDTLQTTNAMLVCVATGTLRTVPIEPDTKPEYLPVDCCSNALLCVAWKAASEKKMLSVYNVTPKPSEIPTVHEAHVVAHQIGRMYPSIRQLLPPAAPRNTKPGKFIFYFQGFLTLMTAFAVDFGIRLAGKKPFFVKLSKRIIRGTAEITVQLHKTRIISDVHNWKVLQSEMSQEERDVFYCDPANLLWRQMLIDMWFRVRRTMLKEPDSNVEAAVARMKRLTKLYGMLGYALVVALIAVVGLLLM